MAETKANTTKKKRVVKNPETFRERAVKANQSNNKQKRRPFKKLWAVISKPFKVVKARLDKLAENKIVSILLKPFRLLGKVLLFGYFKSSWEELKQVTWPTLKQSRQLTFAVVSFAVVFGASIAGLDWVLGKVFKQILLK
jgi:preprotein translocase SecE subunit